MASDEKFKVRNLHTRQWVREALVNGNTTFTSARINARVFEGPAAHAYWAASPDYKIEPEPTPFVFPPTPWREGNGNFCVAANGDDGMPSPDDIRARAAWWAEVRRRVNWHEIARDALLRINNGEDEGEPDRVAFRALAKLPEGPTP